MQLGIQHKSSKLHQVFELKDTFDNVEPEDLIIHLGLNTYTLKTTKTDAEIDIEKRIEHFQETEFASMMEMFPEFGEVQHDQDKHQQLISAIKTEFITRLERSDALKKHYMSLENKDPFLNTIIYNFAQQVAIVRGIENYAKDAKLRWTHECFPIDYSNRILNIMRNILQDKYSDINTLNVEFSNIFQDASADVRPKVGMLRIIVGLEEFTRFLADVMRAGRKVEIYEIKEALKDKAELTFTAIKTFKNNCLEESKNINPLHDDKFADYILQFHNASNKCIDGLTDLDKQQATANMDSLELRHHIDTIVEEVYTRCDTILLRYTMDERPVLNESENAYIIGYYESIYSTCDKSDESDNRYVNLYRHLVNLNMQQKTLFEKMGFPNKLDEFKQYVEHEYTNILHNKRPQQ